MNKRMAVICFVVALTVAAVPGAASIDRGPCEGGEEKIIEERDQQFDTHVVHSFRFDETEKQLCVQIENKEEGNVSGDFVVLADGYSVESPIFTVEGQESQMKIFNLSERFDLLKENHTVSGKTGTGSVKFNFTEDFNSSSSEVSSPYITDVEVLRDQENGSTALEVSTHNPSKLGYSFYVQAETFETKGVYRVDAPQENETSQVVLPLNESSDEVVTGKVRIFDDWANSEGKFDQKEFMARPGNETNAWDDHFERVPGTVDRYDYDNETARQYRDGYVDKDFLSPWERRAGAGLLVALVGGAVWWRRR